MTAAYILPFDILVGKCRIQVRLKAFALTVSADNSYEGG